VLHKTYLANKISEESNVTFASLEIIQFSVSSSWIW